MDAGVQLFRKELEIFSFVEISILWLSIEPLSEQLVFVSFHEGWDNVAGVNRVVLGRVFDSGLSDVLFNGEIVIRFLIRPINQRALLSLPYFFLPWNFRIEVLYFGLPLHLFLQQIVHGCDMVMTIVDNISSCLNGIKVILLHSFYHCFVGHYLVLANDYPLGLIFYLGQIIPLARPDLGDFKSCLRVNIENIAEDISGLSSQKFGHLKLASNNFLIQDAGVGVFKREIAAKHSINDNSAWPDVHVNAFVSLACDHFGSSVARWPACCF